MAIIIGALVFAGIALITYGLLQGDGSGKGRKPKGPRPVRLPEVDAKSQKILSLQEELNLLKVDLEKAKSDFANLSKEAGAAKKEAAELEEKLSKREKWVEKSDETLDKAQQKSLGLAEKLKIKEKELVEEFNKNEALSRQLRDLNEKFELTDEESKRKTREIVTLKFKVDRLAEEMKAHADTASQLQKKQKESQWISKKEFDALNQEYTELEKELEKLEADLQASNNDRVKLKKMLAEQTWRADRQAGHETQEAKESPAVEAVRPPEAISSPQDSVEEIAQEPAKIEEVAQAPVPEEEKQEPLTVEQTQEEPVVEEEPLPQEARKEEIVATPKIEPAKIRNIGIMAHIDAGKTTLSERILFYTGKTHKIGEVHEGKAQMDWMKQEQERGITITAAATTCFWRDNRISLIDTPGHVDFTVEVERSLRILDGAVAVFGAVEGVESQSETVWRQSDKYNVPKVAFVNKMDRLGADYFSVLNQIEKIFATTVIPITIPLGAEDKFRGAVDLLEMKAYIFEDETQGKEFRIEEIPQEFLEVAKEEHHKVLEKVCAFDEELMKKFVDKPDEISKEELKAVIRKGTIANKMVPLLCGSALKNKGVQQLLDAVVDFLPSPADLPAVSGSDPGNHEISLERKNDYKEPFCGLAFKVQSDLHIGKLVYVRVYSGVLMSGSYVLNTTKDKRERVSRLVEMHANQRKNIDYAFAGDIVAVVGLNNTITGDTLSDSEHPILLERIQFAAPVVSLSITPKTRIDQDKLGKGLARLAEEDPTFIVQSDPETKETLLTGMGELHLEIIVDRLKEEFNVEAVVGQPKVAYKETIKDKAKGEGKYIKQSGGRGQYGHTLMELSPAESGKGLDFVDSIKGGAIPKSFIPAVEKGVIEAMQNGVLAGYPVVDVKVDLYDGSFHEVDSSELAFRMAGIFGFKEAFMKASPVLLEPVMKLEVMVPEEFLNNIIGNICQRRGKILNIESKSAYKLIFAQAPLAEMFGYTNAFRSLSSGRANCSMHFEKYEQVPNEIAQKIIEEKKKKDKEDRGG